MGYPKNIKTEHSGAKNGGGYWGKREEAKTSSRKIRRANDKKEVKRQKENEVPPSYALRASAGSPTEAPQERRLEVVEEFESP